VSKRFGIVGFRELGCALTDISDFDVSGFMRDVLGVILPLRRRSAVIGA